MATGFSNEQLESIKTSIWELLKGKGFIVFNNEVVEEGFPYDGHIYDLVYDVSMLHQKDIIKIDKFLCNKKNNSLFSKDVLKRWSFVRGVIGLNDDQKLTKDALSRICDIIETKGECLELKNNNEKKLVFVSLMACLKTGFCKMAQKEGFAIGKETFMGYTYYEEYQDFPFIRFEGFFNALNGYHDTNVFAETLSFGIFTCNKEYISLNSAETFYEIEDGWADIFNFEYDLLTSGKEY